MVKYILLLFLTIMGSTAYAKPQIEQELEQLYSEYLLVKKNPTIEKLVYLDLHLRDFVKNIKQYTTEVKHFNYWKDKYSTMGLFIGHYTPQFGYSEKFLYEAHKLNPHSNFRNYTLFAKIMGIRYSAGLGEMPNIDVSFKYIKEFPEGPFIEDTYFIIANFYKDLFMVLKNIENKNIPDVDYLYNCFKPYINKYPYSSQIVHAKELSIQYYEKVLKINHTNTKSKEYLDKIKAGTIEEFIYCAD